jgi:hypothetical protein
MTHEQGARSRIHAHAYHFQRRTIKGTT